MADVLGAVTDDLFPASDLGDDHHVRRAIVVSPVEPTRRGDIVLAEEQRVLPGVGRHLGTIVDDAVAGEGVLPIEE